MDFRLKPFYCDGRSEGEPAEVEDGVFSEVEGESAASEVEGESSSEVEGESSDVDGKSSEVDGASSAEVNGGSSAEAGGETGLGGCCLACFLEGCSCFEQSS